MQKTTMLKFDGSQTELRRRVRVFMREAGVQVSRAFGDEEGLVVAMAPRSPKIEKAAQKAGFKIVDESAASLFDRVVAEAATPGKQLGQMALTEAKKKWGAGWIRLSGEQQAAAVAFELLRTYGTKPPSSDNPTEQLLHDAWRSVITGLL